jgi:hypothetical protein
MDWLTHKLRLKIRNTFEPRYGRELTQNEVTEIAQSLVYTFEVMARSTPSCIRESKG